MNNKGQSVYLSIVFGIMIFMAGFVILNFIKPEVTNTRDALSCTDSTISDGTKLTCLITDTVVIYFVLIFLSVAGGLITSRFLV